MEKQNNTEQKVNKKPRLTLTWKLITVVISLLIIYTVYHVFFGLSESVPTTVAGLVNQNSSIMLEGVIFRNEEPISVKYQGDMRTYFSNGERVSVDSTVAAIYSDYSGEDKNARIDELKDRIDILERSNVKGLISVVDIEKLNLEIDQLYTSLMLAKANNNNYKIAAIEKELTICLNQMKIYRGEVDSYNAEIAQLQTELDALYESFTGDKEYIYADKGGYFYHSCDGYEETLTYEKLASLTPSSLRDICNQTKENPKIDSAYRCKFVYENTWRIATACTDEIVALLEVGKTYDITVFDIKERLLKVTLEQIGESQNGESVVVFVCSNMPQGFDYSRYQSFKLDMSLVEGYRVPKEALVTLVDEVSGETKTGVYVLSGSTVYFRRVDIIAEGNGYYVASKLDKSKENYLEYLNLNDIIILEPDGMSDGKILKR